MIEVGNTYSLEVIKHVDFGVYLDAEDLGEILLPSHYLPQNAAEWEVGEFLTVFLYLDSEDRPIATTEVPYAEVGQCAYLKVVGKSPFGAFLDWGLMKDLLVPFKEQRIPMEVGKSYVVYIFMDVTNRIAATSLLSKHIPELNEGEFTVRQEVDLLIASRSDLGYKALINGSHLGLIHNSELMRPIKVGDRIKGYIMEPRDDGRINITLQKPALEMRGELSEKIIAYLIDRGGSCGLTDKSAPEEIYATFHASKSNYKKALGKLYKERKVIMEDGLIKLIKAE